MEPAGRLLEAVEKPLVTPDVPIYCSSQLIRQLTARQGASRVIGSLRLSCARTLTQLAPK